MQRYILTTADGQPVTIVAITPAEARTAWAQYCDGFEGTPQARRDVHQVVEHWNQAGVPVDCEPLIDQDSLVVSDGKGTGGWAEDLDIVRQGGAR